MKPQRKTWAWIFLLALLSTILVLSPTSSSAAPRPDAGSFWKHLPGPTLPGGTILNLALAQNHLYALLDGLEAHPLYRSRDAGQHWEQINTIPANSIAAAPDAPDLLLASTWDTLLRSADGGLNWTAVYTLGLQVEIISSTLVYGAGSVVHSIQDGVEPSMVFALSVDGGQTWQEVVISQEAMTTGVWVDPLNAQHLLLSGQDSRSENPRLLESRDGGQTWDIIFNDTMRCGGFSDLVFAPNEPGRLLAANTCSVWISADGGHSWQDTPLQGPSFHLEASGDSVVAVQRWSNDTPVALYRTDDGGRFWWQSLESLPNAVHDLLANPSQPGYLYAGLEAYGVYASANAGAAWSERNAGISSLVDIGALAVSEVDPGLIYAGSAAARGGLFRSLDAGLTWTQVLTGTRVNAIALDPTTAHQVYAGGPQGLWGSADGGAHWGMQSGYPVRDIAISPARPEGVYFGGATYDGDQLKAYVAYLEPCTGGECAWPSPVYLPDLLEVGQLEIHPEQPDLVYAAGPNIEKLGLVLRSIDGGKTFLRTALPPLIWTISDLLADPLRPSGLYAASMQGIYASQDSGLTWKPYSLKLPDPGLIWSLEMDEIGRLYAVNGNQVQRLDPGSQQWHDEQIPGDAGVLALRRRPTPLLYVGGEDGLWVKALPAVRRAWLPMIGN